jgi:hypothetical protein
MGNGEGLRDRVTNQVPQGVNEVANLADKPASALLGIPDPVIGWKLSSADSIGERDWAACCLYMPPRLLDHWSEPSVEAHR